MALFIVLEDFEAPPPTSVRYTSGQEVEDSLLGIPLATLQDAGLAILPVTAGRQLAAARHRAYRGSHPTTTGSHLLALLAVAGELP